MKKRPVEFICILYLIIWTISPIMQIGMIYRIAALGCAGVLFFKNGTRMSKARGYALLFCILVAFSAYIASGSIASILKNISIYMLFIGYLMNEWYENEWDDFRLIVPIVLLVLAFWNYRTLIVLATDSTAARAVVRNDDRANEFLMQGVGGYALMYCQVLIMPAMAQWTISSFRQNKWFFFFGVIWAISFIGYLAEAGYSIAVVSSVIGILLLLFYKGKRVWQALVISILLIGVLIYLIGYNETVQRFLLDAFAGTKVARKIEDITTTITTNQTADSIAVRISRYQDSLNAMFVSYPVIGSWWGRYAGGHSALLDAFALYGIFGGMIMFKMIYCVPMIWKRYICSPIIMRTVNATIVTMTLTALLDSMPFNLVLTPTVLLPILLTDIETWSGTNENSVDCKPDTD